MNFRSSFIFTSLFLLLSLNMSVSANDTCFTAFNKLTAKARNIFANKNDLRKVSAKKLAHLIAVDGDTQELVSNPLIAQYICKFLC